MEPSRFDDLTKALATATSRRQALKTIVATTIGGILGLGGIGTAFADKTCKNLGQGCNNKKNLCCPGLLCQGGMCVAAPTTTTTTTAPPTTTTTTTTTTTLPPCTPNGGTCSGNSDCCSGICDLSTATCFFYCGATYCGPPATFCCGDICCGPPATFCCPDGGCC